MDKLKSSSKKFLNLKYVNLNIIVLLLYIFLIRKILFPVNFQQDDVTEMYVVNYTEFLCVINLGGNHPLFTSFIWIISRLIPSNSEYVISFFNIIVTLFSLVLFYKLIKTHSSERIAFIATLSLLASSNFLVYSISLKQYPIEILGSIFFLGFFYETIKEDSLTFSNYGYLVISLLLSLASLTLLVFFGIILFLIILNKKINPKNYFRTAIIFSPAIYFAPYIFKRINNSNYSDYWNPFFIQTTSFNDFVGSINFIFDLVMNGYFGSFYIARISFVYFLFLLVPLFLKDKISIPVYSVMLIFIFLNFLQFYPLGGGRTDLILFPLVVFIYSRTLFLLKINKKILLSMSILLFLIIPNINNPYYKVENISSILEEIDQYINKTDTFIVPMDEQRHSFEFYSSKLYGQKLSTLSDGCQMFIPDIFNYSIYKPQSEYRMELIQQVLEEKKPSEVFLIGIELKGTDGDIRHAEDYFSKLGYKKYSEQEFDIGMLLIKYEK